MNNNLLRYYIREHNDSLESLSNYLQIHYNTLSLKLCCKREFTQKEISLIYKRYNLTPDELVKIFFD